MKLGYVGSAKKPGLGLGCYQSAYQMLSVLAQQLQGPGFHEVGPGVVGTGRDQRRPVRKDLSPHTISFFLS